MKLFTAVVTALALASAGAAEAQTVLKYATQLPKTHHLTKADYRFAELVEEKSGGRLKVEVYPAGQLYSGPSLVKAVTSGAIEMGIVYGGAWTGPLPLIDLFDIPFLFGDYGAVQRALRGRTGELLRTEMEKREVAKYTTLANASYSIWPVMINLKSWNAFPADLKKVLEEAGAAHEGMTFANAAGEDDESIKLLRERQEVVHVLTAEERAEWAKRMDAVRAEWLSRAGKEGGDVLKWIGEGR